MTHLTKFHPVRVTFFRFDPRLFKVKGQAREAAWALGLTNDSQVWLILE